MTTNHNNWKDKIRSMIPQQGNGISLNAIWDEIDSEIRRRLSEQEAQHKAELEEIKKKVYALKTDSKNYNGNDLDSANDFYGVAANNWSEIIRFEQGINETVLKIWHIIQEAITNKKV